MKKTMIVAATFLLALGAHAQDVHFGIKGGLNAASLHYSDNNNNLETKIGFHAGVLAHIHSLHSHWALQPELLYSSEGAKVTAVGNNDKVHYNLNYLNVPVLVQYMFDNGFRIEGGPQIGFLLSAKSKLNSTTTDIKKSFESIGISIPLGVSYLTHTGLGFDARYSFGLSNINENKNGPTVQSNVFQFGIFYQFSDPKIIK